jgi:signal transduction histidine kinase
VSPTSRRIFRYWLLLLVPTLLVGGGAIALLRREQDRVADQSANAEESHRTAIAARARLIAESVELLAGDVEAGLMETLGEAPAAGLDDFLTQWEANNPLVRITFRAALDGRLLRPQADSPDEDTRGFVRRYALLLGGHPPWQSPAAPAAGEYAKVPEAKLAEDEAEARKRVAANVAQVQSARRDVQELFKIRGYASAPSVAAAESLAAGAPADSPGRNERSQRVAKTEADFRSGAVDAAGREAPPVLADTGAVRVAGIRQPPAMAPGLPGKDAGGVRRGWAASRIDGRQHVIGWIQPAGVDEVRGVELEVVALVGRLGGALPSEFGRGEGYALRDDQGRVLHQVGTIPRDGTPLARLSLAAALLPGWEVTAYSTAIHGLGSDGGGFFQAGVILVAIFVVAILAGGSLLLRQARRSEEEAAQKTSFVANVSHEFKTPLTTIRLYSELLEQGRVRDAAQGGDYLRTIGRETQRLARLVNNALDFSRLEQGRKQFAREELDLVAELTRLLDTHAPRVAEAGLTLRRQLPAGPVRVVADRDAVEQIVLNLIDNACKYAAAGGELLVTMAPQPGGGAEVRVSDRGPGIPPGHRERIFEKFHRVDEALTAEKSGAGLGLSIARQLARGLGGRLAFAPRPGGGSEFVLTLP